MRKLSNIKILITFLCATMICICSCTSNSKDIPKQPPQRDNWEVTQYVGDSGGPEMFYTIYDEEKDILIVVDGGCTETENQVREVIKSKGNRVSAWFLTHYHNDHVGVLNEILANPQEITIDKIYASPIDYDRYMAEAQWWDAAEYYTRFRELTNGLTNVVYCQRFDEISVGDMKVKVLNAYDDIFIAANTGDIHNNGGLVLRFDSKNKSMLFMGDVHNQETAQLLLDNCKDDLSCDYTQIGHHGNNTIDYSFYDQIGVKEAFFDGPGWLMESEEHYAKPLLEYFGEKGIKCYDYRSGSNTVIMD